MYQKKIDLPLLALAHRHTHSHKILKYSKIPCHFPTLLDLLQSYEGSLLTTMPIAAEHHGVIEDEKKHRERMPTQYTLNTRGHSLTFLDDTYTGNNLGPHILFAPHILHHLPKSKYMCEINLNR